MGNQPSSSDNNDNGATIIERDVESNNAPSEVAQEALTTSLLPQEPETFLSISEPGTNGGQVERETLSPNDNDNQAVLPTIGNSTTLPLNADGEALSFQQRIHHERRKRDSLYEAILNEESNTTKNISNSNTNLLESEEPGTLDRIKLLLQRQDAIIRDLVEQEEFLSRHYNMFCDADKEQNDLILSWMTCFGMLQGFLWVSLALSMNSSRRDIWYSISIVTCCIGMVISFFTVFKVRQARATKKKNLESWNALLEDFTSTCRFNILSIGLGEGYSVNSISSWPEAIPVVCVAAWGVVLVVIASSGMVSVLHSYDSPSDNATAYYTFVESKITDASF